MLSTGSGTEVARAGHVPLRLAGRRLKKAMRPLKQFGVSRF